MTDQPNTFVAGFGRCGTTAMMQLLWAGGAPVAGPPPAFEDSRLGLGGTNVDWVRAQRGKVLKWIDPSRNRLPSTIKAKTIWMDRRAMQQARSQVKMLRTLGPFSKPLKPALSAMAKSLKRDRAPTLAALRKRGPVLVVDFRDLLNAPVVTALIVQDFLGEDFLPNPLAGSKAILKRGPECMPDMWIEQSTSIAWDAHEAAQ